MQSASPGVADASRSNAPYSPPQQHAIVRRERLIELLDSSTDAARVTVVSAPSGFGKTVAVGDWARRTPMPVAWLSLTRYDADPSRLLAGVLASLRRTASASGDPGLQALLSVDPGSRSIAASHRALVEALMEVDGRIVLVVDDLHRAGSALRRGILGGLVEQAPASLRLVLVGRESRPLPFERLLLAGDAALVEANALRFDAEEVAAAAEELGRPVSVAAATAIAEATDGWPAAVRLSLVSSSGAPAPALRSSDGAATLPALTDFVADEVLAALPNELAEFILDTTTTSDVDSRLAVTLSGRSDATALLDECVRRGLFLDRFGDDEAGASYRWHSVFASRCRSILARRDPDRARRLHRVAADFLVDGDPLRSIDESLAGGDAESAARTLRESWVGLLVGPNSGSVERACAVLLPALAEDPELLFIRAYAIELDGNHREAQRLFARASQALDLLEPAERERIRPTRSLVSLFIEDDYRTLSETLSVVEADLADPPPGTDRRRAGVLLMLGMTQLRIRWNPEGAVRTLEAAEREALVIGDRTIRRRATELLAFAQGFRGDFAASRATIARLEDTSAVDGWHSAIGDVANAAAGWNSFWSNDLRDAALHFRRVVESGSRTSSFSGIAVQYLAYIAAIAGDHRDRVEAAELLRATSEIDTHGVPWPAYRLIATAKLAEAEGHADRAAAIARRFEQVGHIPAAAVILAEIARRHVSDSAAVALLDQLREVGSASYVRASSLVTLALVHRSRGDYRGAHERLERALEIAEPAGVARPFSDDREELRDLLLEHASWGTRHAAFIASLETPRAGPVLSEREREVLGYLRTPMTATEIAAALGVSVNTVKTHLRMIYRKLGVASRREAVRAVA